MNKLIILFLAFLITNVKYYAQELKYRRSSLHMVLLESETFPKKDLVLKAYNSKPFPEKYNNHSLESKSFDPKKYIITPKEREEAGKKSSKLGKMAGKAVSESSGGVVDSLAKDIPLQIEKYIKDKQIAKQLVKKWFNVKADGKPDYELIKERGMYAISDAEKSAAGDIDFTTDYELVGNTFVIFNKLIFVENEPVARQVRDVAYETAKAQTNEMLRTKGIEAADKIYEKTKEGYSVWTTSWLYQLEWNEAVVEKFKSYFLNESINPVKAWDTTSLFNLKFVGTEKVQSLVTFSLKEKRTEEQIINLSVNRNIDKVFSSLQRNYEVFRPVTPINSVGPITAMIGLKEGLEPGDSFDILESKKDKVTGAYKWVSIGSASVDKKLPIYDNRFGAQEEPALDEKGNPITKVTFTTFSGGKEAMKGMHFLRLKK
jgi:hypothetical protein